MSRFTMALLSLLYPATVGGMALGSWLGMLPILVFAGLFIRRRLVEDRLLQHELPGYAEYAKQVRYRLIIGVF